ncbi:hypothetical protein ACET3Z_010585 [Daucus carota]
MCVKRRVSPIESNESNTEKKVGLELKSNESKRKRVWSWRVESVGDNFTTPPMSSKRKSRYIGPTRHEWTAEQEELVIVSFISSLNSDMGRPDYLKKMTWSEIKQRAIELYRVKFGQEPYVTANKIRNKVDWLRDAYDQKDTSAFLDRLVSDHGSVDLEWLRDIPLDKAKQLAFCWELVLLDHEAWLGKYLREHCRDSEGEDRNFVSVSKASIEEGAPDYHRIVKRPMNISTIKEKVRNLEYKSRKDFRHDMWQIAYNTHLYNDKRNPGIPPLADQLWSFLTTY